MITINFIEAQKKINKINDKYTEIAKIKKEVVDLYTQEFKYDCFHICSFISKLVIVKNLNNY